MCCSLQPYVPQPATLCAGACNPTCWSLQPYVCGQAAHGPGGGGVQCARAAAHAGSGAVGVCRVQPRCRRRKPAGALCILQCGHCPLPTAHCPLRTTHCPLRTTHCPLPAAHCPLPTAHCPLLTAHCPPPTTFCRIGAPWWGCVQARWGSGQSAPSNLSWPRWASTRRHVYV